MKSSARCLLVVAFALGACGDDATSTPAQCTLTCTNPPASECVGSALRSYASPGACSGAAPDFVCTYGFVDYACENGCEAGACKGVVDPCADVVCNAPPAARCDGDQLETFTNLGTCDGGTCSYGSVKLPCTQGCEDGACAGDPCADVVCNAPPSTCHAATGTCSSGVCSYPVLTGAACDDGVACTEDDTCGSNAVCMGDAIACQSPPAPVCDGNTLKVAAATGTCAAGACDYAVTDVVCADGCSNGACLGNPCANVVCDSPPTPCHVDSGTCQNGVCAYAFDNGASCDDGVACTEGDTCTNGVCGGTVRTCVTPPAAACKDAETLVVNASAGSCADGACSYVGIDVPCAFGCVTVDGVGRCEGDPCGGVTCLTPPAATCANTTSLVVPARTGVCSGGNCSYDNVVFTCIHGCQPATGADAFCKAPTGLVIAELLVDSAGFPDTDAFIEIHGPPGTQLDGVTVVAVNGNGGGDYQTIALSGTLDAQGLFVVAHPDAVAAIADVADLLDEDVDFQNGPDSVQLRFGAIVLDALAYGDFEDSDVAAGEGTPAAVAPVDQAMSRDHEYNDSNDNAADFAARVPTPAAPTPAPVVNVPPVAALTCPATGETGAALTFDATPSSATNATITAYTFDFGDTSEDVSGAAGSVTHTFTAAGTFTVTVTVTDSNALTDDATCSVTITEPVVVETPVEYVGVEQCFGGNDYQNFDVLSNPPAPTTDGLLVVTFRGTSPYGPAPYTFELQVGADSWVEVAKTNHSKLTDRTERFRIPQATLKQAIDAMGWVRIRHGRLTNPGTNNCVQVTLRYNCAACFACPAGQEDLGIGCQPTNVDYDYTAIEHNIGQCGTSYYDYDQLYLPGAPEATGDGIFAIEFAGCGGTSIDLELFTANSGWVDVGSSSAASCVFGSGDWTIPEAYLDAAIDGSNRIRFRWSVNDSCAAGVGCSSFSEPCVKNARLIYPR